MLLRKPPSVSPTESALQRATAQYVARSQKPLPQLGLSGTVRDPERNPIAGARVCAGCANCEPTGAAPSPCTVSDEQGAYGFERLDKGGYYLSASADGFVPGSPAGGEPVFIDAAPRAGLDIVLRPGGETLAGVVLDATGGPISHAHVRAIRMEAPRIALEMESDDLGRFRFSFVPGHVLLTAEADGYAPARAAYAAPNTDAKLVLTPGGGIEGHVVTADGGQPIPGVQVRVVPDAMRSTMIFRAAISDERGHFALDGLEPGRYAVIARGDRFTGELPEPIELGLAAKRTGIRIELQAATEVSGTVVSGSGKDVCRQGGFVALGGPDPTRPLPFDALDQNRKAIAAVRDQPPGPEQVALIQADGSVHFPGVPSGYYFVAVHCFGHDLRSGPRMLTVSGEPEISGLRWEVERGVKLAVRVLDGSGAAVAGARFMLKYPDPGEDRPTPIYQMETDSTGRNEVPGLPFGRYELQAPGGTEQAEPVTVELRHGQERVEATLKLRGSGTIEAEVKANDGSAVEDARLSVLRASDPTAAPAPNDRAADALIVDVIPLGRGRFRLGPLSAGRYLVRADDGVNPPVESGSELEVAGGQTARTTLVLDRGGSISGRVLDDNNDPLPNVWVSVAYVPEVKPGGRPSLLPFSSPKRVLTDEEGSYRLEGLSVSGTRYTLRAEEPYGSAAVKRDVRAGDTVELTLFAPRAITGLAVDARGQPLQRFSVRAESREAGVQRVATFDDRTGRFSITNVIPGRVQLTLSTETASTDTEIDLAPGRDVSDVRLVLTPTDPSEAQASGEHATEFFGVGR